MQIYRKKEKQNSIEIKRTTFTFKAFLFFLKFIQKSCLNARKFHTMWIWICGISAYKPGGWHPPCVWTWKHAILFAFLQKFNFLCSHRLKRDFYGFNVLKLLLNGEEKQNNCFMLKQRDFIVYRLFCLYQMAGADGMPWIVIMKW